MDSKKTDNDFLNEVFAILKKQPEIKQAIRTFDDRKENEPCENAEQINIQEQLEQSMDDPVNHPSHYNYGKIEVIDYIEDKGFDYLIGNAIKYLSRAGHKNDEIEDLEKAIWYITRKINKLKSERK